MSVQIWTEKYRPHTLEDYVWQDANHKKKVLEWIADRATPHLLFSGRSGTGKTSLAYLILEMIGIPKGDILFIAASRERKVDNIQDRIISFISTWALNDTGIKYVILDEADTISPLAQKMLRTEMETYAANCRFILTCNYGNKIIEPIQGRCQSFQFNALDRETFTERAASILLGESVEISIEPFEKIVDSTYPDLRKCINVLQKNVVGNVLCLPTDEQAGAAQDYLDEVAALFKAGRTLEARRLLVAQAAIEDYIDVYRYLYQNLHLFGETQDQQDQALIIIRRGLVNHTVAGDPEINLAAAMAELSRIK